MAYLFICWFINSSSEQWLLLNASHKIHPIYKSRHNAAQVTLRLKGSLSQQVSLAWITLYQGKVEFTKIWIIWSGKSRWRKEDIMACRMHDPEWVCSLWVCTMSVVICQVSRDELMTLGGRVTSVMVSLSRYCFVADLTSCGFIPLFLSTASNQASLFFCWDRQLSLQLMGISWWKWPGWSRFICHEKLFPIFKITI